MYLLEVKDVDSNKPLISLQGRIENFSVFKKELLEIMEIIKKAEVLIIDLSGVEFISDDCLTIFSEIVDTRQVRFANYSLHIEDKLRSINISENNLTKVINNEFKTMGS